MNISKKVYEFIYFLEYSFSFYKITNTLFYISDKKYFINIVVNNEQKLNVHYFDKDEFDKITNDYNYDLYFDISEKLLVKLYQTGVSLKELFIYLKNDDIKCNNFGIFKFYAFIKNFNFSPEKWFLFIKTDRYKNIK